MDRTPTSCISSSNQDSPAAYEINWHFCQSRDPWTQRPTVSSRVEKGHWCSAGVTPRSLMLPIWRADCPLHIVTSSSVTALHSSKGHHSHQSPLGPLYVVTMAEGNINGSMRHQEAHLPGRQVTSILALRNGLSHYITLVLITPSII